MICGTNRKVKLSIHALKYISSSIRSCEKCGKFKDNICDCEDSIYEISASKLIIGKDRVTIYICKCDKCQTTICNCQSYKINRNFFKDSGT